MLDGKEFAHFNNVLKLVLKGHDASDAFKLLFLVLKLREVTCNRNLSPNQTKSKLLSVIKTGEIIFGDCFFFLSTGVFAIIHYEDAIQPEKPSSDEKSKNAEVPKVKDETLKKWKAIQGTQVVKKCSKVPKCDICRNGLTLQPEQM